MSRRGEQGERTGGRTSVQADEHSERTGAGTLGGRADGGGQWAGGQTGWRTGGLANGWTGRTGGRRISEGKTPNLTRHLTWLWEIQRGYPRKTIKLPHLPPPSR